MAIYMVHVPDAAPDALTRGERTVFVRDGFSARAFVFGLLYLLWHRLWGAAALWVGAAAALAAFALVLHPSPAALVALLGLMHLYLGCEGPDLVRRGLERRGFGVRDIVSAPGLEAAEILFFTRQPSWPTAGSPPRPAAAPLRPRPATTPAVIGFPDETGP